MATDTDFPSSDLEEEATISFTSTKPSTEQLVAWEYAADLRAASTPPSVHNLSISAILDEGPPPQWPQTESLSEKEALLRAWVSSHGGWISSSLELGKSPTCDGIGWIASKAVSEGEAATTPLIVMPHCLALHVEDAVAALRMLLARAGNTAHLVDRNIGVLLESQMSTGFLLAYEKKKGRASHFWPYMCLLPQTPQCLWWQPSNEAAGLAEIAQRAGWSPERMAKALWFCDDERRYINELLQHLSHLGVDAALGLTPAELKWGFATANARFAVSGKIFPVMDLLNHNPEAGQIWHTPGSVMAPAVHFVASMRKNKAKALAAGEELFIFYPDDDEWQQLARYGAVLEPSTLDGPRNTTCSNPVCPGFAARLLHCQRCRQPYCSRSCQLQDWPSHKALCRAIERVD